MADESIEYYTPGKSVTGHATAAVTGKRFVRITGNRVGGNIAVAHAAAGADVVGVTMQTKPLGAKVGLHVTPGAVVPVTASGAIPAGASVVSTADGRAIVAGAGVPACGKCWDGAADGEDAMIQLLPHSTAV